MEILLRLSLQRASSSSQTQKCRPLWPAFFCFDNAVFSVTIPACPSTG
jgi:hypothetical protein